MSSLTARGNGGRQWVEPPPPPPLPPPPLPLWSKREMERERKKGGGNGRLIVINVVIYGPIIIIGSIQMSSYRRVIL